MGNGPDISAQGTSKAVDDRGTTQGEGRELLQRVCDEVFQGDEEQFALALGRPVAEVAGMLKAGAEIDDDVVMKARGIAQERE